MPGNTVGAIDVPLSLFGGLNTELAPSDLPEGASPDNQDVVFVPGSVAMREALRRIFPAASFPGQPTLVYGKTYITPDGTILTLLLDSAGRIWREDVLAATVTQVGQVLPGARAQSVSAFGREYLALSDGLHGLDVPRQFDGTNFDRVSQDGPGAGPTSVTDAVLNKNIATVTMAAGAAIAAAPAGAHEEGTTATITTTTAHGLKVGDQVQVTGVGVGGYNGNWVVTAVPTATTFSYTALAAALADDGGGNAYPLTVEVTTTLPHGAVVGDTVVLAGTGSGDYNNNSGTTPASWIVTAVITAVDFQFIGNNHAGTFHAGTVQINGLVEPGARECVVIFQTRSGYLTKPSPAVAFVTAGGKKIQVNNLPIGPANAIARICAFPAAGGLNFFYIPVPARVNGKVVSTSTVVNDNVSTSAVFDFSDNTLLAATAIDIPGNDLFSLVVLGPCLGCYAYAERLFAWGERNKVQNLLNMGFEGGVRNATPTVPLGWAIDSAGGALVDSAIFGKAWKITGDGTANSIGRISQPASTDEDGAPILEGGTRYLFRCWALSSGVNGDIVAELYDLDAAAVLAKATIPVNSVPAVGAFVQAKFDADTPDPLPPNTVLRLYTKSTANLQTVTLDECEIIFSEQPFFPSARASYVGSPESFDGVTGVIGPAADPNPLVRLFTLRNSLYFQTSDRLHQTNDQQAIEPASWGFLETAQRVGPAGVLAGDSGEDWHVWATLAGLRIFEGGAPYKISQEIQSLWDRINPSAANTIWVTNDSRLRRIYVGVPVDGATAPNLILLLDYRELDTAAQVSDRAPLHISLAGKMITSDLARKWTRWNAASNFGAVLDRGDLGEQFCLCDGNGQTPGVAPGFGNLYRLDASKFTDDDYGQIVPYYVTYFFVNHEMEQALGVGSHRKLFAYLALFLSGIGKITITPFADILANAWTPTPAYQLSPNQNHDLEWGLNVNAERVAFKLQSSPLPGQTDTDFDVGKLIVTIKQDPIMPVRGSI